MKRLVSFTSVKNEADIIETFVRHNLRYLDQMHVSVNLATDSTLEILQALRDEGLSVVITENNEPKFNQKLAITDGYRRIAADPGADMISFLDADEFLQEDIRELLGSKWAPGRVFTLERYEYIYLADVPLGEPCLERMVLRKKKLQRAKTILCNPGSDFQSYTIGTGSHHVYRKGIQVEPELLETKLGHYPCRSVAQFVEKSVMGWLGFIRADPALMTQEKAIGAHWRNGSEWVKKQGFSVDAEALVRYLYKVEDIDAFRAALLHAPFSATSLEIKYAHLIRSQSLLSFLLESAEQEVVARHAAEREAAQQASKRAEAQQKGTARFTLASHEAVLLNGAVAYGEKTIPRVRTRDGIVELSGAIKGVKSSTLCPIELLAIPSELAPDRSFQFVNVGSQKHRNAWQMQPNGKLKLLSTSMKSADEDSWFPFHAVWLL